MQRLLRIRDIEYFLALAEHQSFARAAEALGVTQPTLSNQIRKIEEALGCRAFRREGRDTVLTPEGEAILEHGQRVLSAFYDLERATRGEAVFSGGPIRFGVIATASPYLGPPLLDEIRARSPGGTVSFVEGLTEELERRVAKGELDFAVTATLPKHRDLSAQRIAAERLVYLSGAPISGDPFASRPAADGRRPILLMHEGHCFREAVFASISRANAALADAIDYAITPASLATLVSLVRSGFGDAVGPAPYAAGVADLWKHPLDPSIFQRTLHLITRKGRDKLADLASVATLAADIHAGLANKDGPV